MRSFHYLLVMLVVTAWLRSSAAASAAASFPFYKCPNDFSAYSLAPQVRQAGEHTFCFTLQVSVPSGCTSYCCKQADLKKIEFNVNPECKVPGATVAATLNGVPTKVGPSFDSPKTGPAGSTILRITQLGLNLATADGAELCLTLKPNKAGKGCTTLEDLCVPPPGAAPGTCSSALFDSKLQCCAPSSYNPLPASPVSPPPSSSSPPLRPSILQPPPPPPANPPCKFCVTATLRENNGIVVPYAFPESHCRSWQAAVSSDITEAAAFHGAALDPNTPFSGDCGSERMELCGAFATDADGDKVSSQISFRAKSAWYEKAFGPQDYCPAYLALYEKTITVGGPGGQPSCVGESITGACDDFQPKGFPGSGCDDGRMSSSFRVSPYIDVKPGRFNNTALYCFSLLTWETYATRDGPCGTVLDKFELRADDAKRGKVKGIGLQRAGSDRMNFISPSWGPVGSRELRATSLGWTAEDADGGLVCVELDKSLDLKELCSAYRNGNGNCWTALWDKQRECCPVYPATTRP